MTIREYFDLRRAEIDINEPDGWERYFSIDDEEYDLYQLYFDDEGTFFSKLEELNIVEDYSEEGSFAQWIWDFEG